MGNRWYARRSAAVGSAALGALLFLLGTAVAGTTESSVEDTSVDLAGTGSGSLELETVRFECPPIAAGETETWTYQAEPGYVILSWGFSAPGDPESGAHAASVVAANIEDNGTTFAGTFRNDTGSEVEGEFWSLVLAEV